MKGAEERLAALGIELPDPPRPAANYVEVRRVGNLLYTAGHGPLLEDGSYLLGRLGESLGVEEGYRAARRTGIALLATLRAELGSLDRVGSVVKVTGFVNSAPGFGDQPRVIDGCSDLFIEVFRERGRHARSALGVSSLPIGIAVEIELVVEVVD